MVCQQEANKPNDAIHYHKIKDLKHLLPNLTEGDLSDTKFGQRTELLRKR